MRELFMGVEVNIRLLEHIRPVGPDTTRITGYKPAGFIIDDQVRTGHVLDPDELKRIKNFPYLYAELQLDIGQELTDIAPFLNATNEGREWLEMLQERYDGQVSTEMLFRELPFIPVRYTKYPDDYFDRLNKDSRYQVPRAEINRLPKGARYVKAVPLMRTKTGEWMRSLFYNRKVRDPKGKIEGYAILEEEKEYGNAAGIFLGTIEKEDFRNQEGDFEVDFPLEHYLEVAFPVWIGEKGRNPLSIEIYLKKDK